MRIAQVLLSPRLGGAESLALSIENGWRAAGHETKIFYLDAGDSRSKFRRSRLARSLRHYRADAILSHSAIPNIYSRLAAPRGTPVVTVLHSAVDDFESAKLRLLEKVLRRRTSAVVAVNEFQLASYVTRFGPKVPSAVIPNGIRDGLGHKTAYESSPRIVMTIARVAEQKNPQFWMDVVSRASERMPGLDFRWHGPVTPQPGMSEIVASAKGTAARFLPPTTNPGTELSQADIVFHPASREAFSIALLEAAAVGVPVICSDTVYSTFPADFPFTTYVDLDVASAAAAICKVSAEYGRVSAAAAVASSAISSTYSETECAARYLALLSTSSAH